MNYIIFINFIMNLLVVWLIKDNPTLSLIWLGMSIVLCIIQYYWYEEHIGTKVKPYKLSRPIRNIRM